MFWLHFAALALQLDKQTVGYLTYNGGMQSTMSTVIERNTENHHMALTLTIGVPHCFVAASYTRKLIEREMKLKLATKFVIIVIVLFSCLNSVFVVFMFIELEHLVLLLNMVQRKKCPNIVQYWHRYRLVYLLVLY